VTKAKSLLEKGKGGNDAYCMIGMGKEKFLTSVKPKTLSPVWEEQAEFQLGEKDDLKITVYHKSSIIDEFIGRVLINIADLASQDNFNHSYTNWYKLGGKPEKSKKPEKERGEIEVRVDFVIKPKAGSMMDLSMKSNKDKSGSLRNLKEKIGFKGSISEKIGSKLKKSGQPKYNGENQLAEQAKRMAGSKLDFLEGDDIGSITSSYSSINGSSLTSRQGGNGQMSRFNPGRQSFLSRASSQGLQNDTSSIYGNDNSRNDEDFDDHFKLDDDDNDSLNGSSFQRRNSSRFGSTLSRSNIRVKKAPVLPSSEAANNSTNNESENSGIYIAPLQLFNENTSTPQLTPRLKTKNSSHDT